MGDPLSRSECDVAEAAVCAKRAARVDSSQSERQVRSGTIDESERAVRLDSAEGSTVEGASTRPRDCRNFVKGGLSDHPQDPRGQRQEA